MSRPPRLVLAALTTATVVVSATPSINALVVTDAVDALERVATLLR